MKKDLNVEIGERIKTARKAVGFSRDEFSEMLGISSLFLGYIECGQRGMSIQTLKNICSCLKVSSDYILFGEKESDTRSEIISCVDGIEEKYLPVALESINSLKRILALAEETNKSER